MSPVPAAPAVPPAEARPELEPEPSSGSERALVLVFVVVPLLAVLAAVPLAWSAGWLHGSDVVIAALFYVISGLGVTVGFHRYFTHGSFKAVRPLRVALAVAGSLSLEMTVIDWVATHRRHHKYSDLEGDPHSPWRFGTGFKALVKGLFFAHMGWLFSTERTNRQRYAPDLMADRSVRWVHDQFAWLAMTSMTLPGLLGGLVSWSWFSALTGFFWGSLVRVSVLHHVTWAINSVCHVFGARHFRTRDRSRNVWWLAIPSFGESWHNLHHADPTCARHGVLRGQLDPSARVIRWFEQLGWASDVRWPTAERLAARRLPAG
jgi:stearoyl-CoA desaturase (delta-9 desaturase)